MPLTVATTILGDPDSYPLLLVGLAAKACRQRIASDTKAVFEIAKAERWFSFDDEELHEQA
jgi:hypothetical protein